MFVTRVKAHSRYHSGAITTCIGRSLAMLPDRSHESLSERSHVVPIAINHCHCVHLLQTRERTVYSPNISLRSLF